MQQSTVSRSELAGLLRQDVDELNALLAQSDPDADDALHSFESARQWGENVMQRLSASLSTCICDEWNYCKRRKTQKFGDDVSLAVEIANLIFKIVGAYPVAVIASILVKKGLDAFCGCNRD
jgi:hypothetical protein